MRRKVNPLHPHYLKIGSFRRTPNEHSHSVLSGLRAGSTLLYLVRIRILQQPARKPTLFPGLGISKNSSAHASQPFRFFGIFRLRPGCAPVSPAIILSPSARWRSSLRAMRRIISRSCARDIYNPLGASIAAQYAEADGLDITASASPYRHLGMVSASTPANIRPHWRDFISLNSHLRV